MASEACERKQKYFSQFLPTCVPLVIYLNVSSDNMSQLFFSKELLSISLSLVIVTVLNFHQHGSAPHSTRTRIQGRSQEYQL